MNRSKKSTSSFFPLPLSRVARKFTVFGACLTASAVAVSLPLMAQQQRPSSGISEIDVAEEVEASADRPASMGGMVTVMVEMNDAPAAIAYSEALKVAQEQAAAERAAALADPARRQAASKEKPKAVQIDAAAASRVKDQVQKLDVAQQALVPRLTSADIGGKVLYRVQRAYNGIAVLVDSSKISEIQKLPGVRAARIMIPKTQSAFSDIDFLGARSFWTKVVPGALGIHGENVRVAVIDSGLDYVHTNFGGNGDYTGVTDTNSAGKFPNAKVPGGFDFAGDSYSAGVQDTPFPDTNPMDSINGHGTACASLVGGYGVNFGGSTYFGNYDNSTPIAGMKISPGFAPNCRLIPLRVFGISGSTNLVTQAIDYAIDPNNDGDFSDKVEIISMSLGSNNGTPDDDSAVAASNAAAVGTVVVCSAGNAGDTYYITGSPSVATGVISVAASFNDQAGFIYDARVRANSPAAIAGQDFFAIYGTGPNKAPAGGLTRDLVYARPANGSTAFTNAAFVTGKIALIDRGVVGFLLKVQNAQAAGAVGVVMVNNAPGDPIVMGALETTTIPAVMISLADGNAIKAAAAFDPTTGVPANATNVTINNDNGIVQRAGTSSDTLPTYSSRGPRLPDSMLKPDLTAPAEVVGVADSLGGSAVTLFNGTSSACPHVSGSMALMKQLHPDWSVQELNALVMNTATSDLFTTSPSASPTPAPTPLTQIGVGRIGAGRIDLTKASQSNVVAYNISDAGHVNVSFGVVEVPVDSPSTIVTKDVRVVNKGTTDVSYTLTYQDVTPVPGAAFTLPAAPVVIPAGGTVTVPVSFEGNGSALKHVREASVAANQGVTGGTLARHYLTEKTGYMVMTPRSGPVIRVALYAAPKPASAMRAASNGFVPTASNGSYQINLTGAGIDGGLAQPTDIVSLVKPFELQYSSPLADSPSAGTDPDVIKHVGITSDYANPIPAASPAAAKSTTRVSFGIDGFGDVPVPSFVSSDKEIFIDTNLDGNYDFAVYLDSRRIGTTHSNVYFPVVVNLATNAALIQGLRTNGFSPASLDTNSLNNSAVVIPIPATSLGLIGTNGAGPTKFQYQVVTFIGNDVIDETPVLTYDLANPGFELSQGFTEPSFFDDVSGNFLLANWNGTNYQSNGSTGILLLHMHNGVGQRSEAIAFRKPTIASFSPSSAPIGGKVTIRGTNFGPGTEVRFFNNKLATNVTILSANTLIATVPPGTVNGPIRVSNAAGFSTRGGFTVTVPPGPSPSPSASPSPPGPNARKGRLFSN